MQRFVIAVVTTAMMTAPLMRSANVCALQMDFNLLGMGHVNLSQAVFREPLPPTVPLLRPGWEDSSLTSDMHVITPAAAIAAAAAAPPPPPPPPTTFVGTLPCLR